MLYFLLIIIAVGVLLASEAGKELLGWLIKFAIFAGGAYLAFWIVVIVIGLLSPVFSDKNTRDGIFAVAGTLMFIGYGIYGIYLAYKRLKTKEKRAEIVVKLKNKIKYEWREHKAKFIFIVALVLIIILCWLVLPFIL